MSDKALLDSIFAQVDNENLWNIGALCLGELILSLEVLPSDLPVVYEDGRLVGYLDSYRGYYRFLALGACPDFPQSVGSLLTLFKEAVGKTFTGYKGGDFVMHRGTFVFAANYGDSFGDVIVGVKQKDGQCILKTAKEHE